mmetsp:Transcript_9549/g.16437  ORF Transcript_9549/g.16437 Transcript_9549/m.16437 type:complete len:304 (-) Transcript_9549:254-1165(-)
MQGIEEDPGYHSTEDDFHLTTSDEFVGGGHDVRRRAAVGSVRGMAAAASHVSEELDLEELKLWDEEEMHCSRAPHVPRVPAAEVLQLLREVPPSLRSRYCARLRLEAQRRRAAAAEGAEGAAEGRWRRWTWISWISWIAWMACCILVICATWAHPKAATAMASPMTSMTSMSSMSSLVSVAAVPSFQRTSQRSPGSPVNGTAGAGAGCPEALKKAEDEAIAMEVLTKRDIMGYNQMLASIHDWSSTLTTRVPTSIASCLQVEGPKFLKLVEDLRASLLSAHARAARARARLTMERNTRIFLSE